MRRWSPPATRPRRSCGTRCRGSGPGSCSMWAGTTSARTSTGSFAPTPSSPRDCARPLSIRPRDLVLTGFVTDRQLAALYRACELFVFPSLYEGAGLPVLEAMSCGAPVAASNTTSIPELLGDPEGSFDPSDPSEIARCVGDVLETPGTLESLRDRSRRRVALYTWDRVARETVPAYERAMELPGRGRRLGRSP